MKLIKRILSPLKKNEHIRVLLFRIYMHVFGMERSISGSNNVIKNDGALIKKVNLKILGNNNMIEFGKGSRLSNVEIRIQGDNHRLLIGEDCYMGKGSFWFEDTNGKICIGSKTTIEDADFASIESVSVQVGNDCMFSFGIDIRPGDSHSIIDLATNKRINPAEDIVIGNHVWIGAKETVLKGVKIADCVIVGNGAIVTKTCAKSNCIIAGVPAKVVKEDVDWCRKRL